MKRRLRQSCEVREASWNNSTILRGELADEVANRGNRSGASRR
jgi:hypothetical protein